jgi:imidazolonepropionase-like amidohydrolase
MAIMSTLVLRAGGMFDGVRAHGPVTIEVTDGTVTAINPTRTELPSPSLIDLGEQVWLLPGLIDSHVHLAFDAGPDPVASLAGTSDSDLLPQMRTAAKTALQAGITTVRDLGDRGYTALQLASEIAQDPSAGPHILSAGAPLTTPGGHCYFLGGQASGIDSLRAAVRERHSHGCAVIKVMAGGGNMTPGSPMHESQYSVAELRAIVDEAHALGLPVTAHAHGTSTIVDALDAGVDSIEHVTFLTGRGIEPDPALLKRLAASNVFLSLTVGADPEQPAHPAYLAAMTILGPVYRELHESGAQLVIGSDAGVHPSKPHDVLPIGVMQLTDMGIPPAAALAAVTSVAARACGIDGRKGRIVVGADADLLAIDGDPLDDITRLRDVRAVFRAGLRVR